MPHLFRRMGLFIAAWVLLLASSAAFAGSPSVLTFTKAFGASSIEINGSTSLTFNLSLNSVGGGGGTGAIGFTDSLPAGLVVATPNGATAVACTGGSTPGTVTATAGSGNITLAGANIQMSSNCSFSVNVTGTTLGVKNNSVTTSAAYVVGGTVTANASLTVAAAAVAAPTQPIPNQTTTPATGIGTQPTAVDLSKGQGPSMTTCMINAVKGIAGFSQAEYLGQDTYGVASIDLKDGRYLSFYPLLANTDTSRPPGLYFSGNNRASLATSCGSFDIVPAVYNLAKLGTVLAAGQSADARLSFNSDGVATYVQGGTTYVARPDFYVTRGSPGIAGLTLTGDAYSFNDGAGNTQLIRGAFSDADVLRVAIASAGHVGSLVGQSDGTFAYTFTNGRRCSLRADMQLLPANAYSSVNPLFYDLGNGNFLYRGNALLMWQRMGYTCVS